MLPGDMMMTVSFKNVEKKSLTELSNEMADVKRKALNTNMNEALFESSFRYSIKKLKRGHVSETFFRLLGTKFGKSKAVVLTGEEKKEYEKIPREDRLTADDIEVGTTTVSNIGSLYLGQRGSTALLEIIQPQVSAFAIGALTNKPIAVEKEDGTFDIQVEKILPICIAFDHRALDFGEVIPFMKRLDFIFENPKIMHEWIERD